MEKITWEFVQSNSDKILSDGLHKLKNAPFLKHTTIKEITSCNYLISHNEAAYYIGEGENASKRLIQQFKIKTSTFYPSYQKIVKSSQNTKILDIETFNIQLITTNIGRKEVEEFGIVNLSPLLNKFQLNKRLEYKIECHNGLWDKVQNEKSNLLKEAEILVLNGAFDLWFENNAPSVAGIYIVKNKNGEIIYIGETSLLSKRYMAHSKRTYFSSLRRHIGTEILGYQLQELKNKKRYFDPNEDLLVTHFLKTCLVSFYPVSFGRYELESHLIKQHKPILNRKDNYLNEPTP
jgi:predicted GIY-YIG superfamily endonuclease